MWTDDHDDEQSTGFPDMVADCVRAVIVIIIASAAATAWWYYKTGGAL